MLQGKCCRLCRSEQNGEKNGGEDDRLKHIANLKNEKFDKGCSHFRVCLDQKKGKGKKGKKMQGGNNTPSGLGPATEALGAKSTSHLFAIFGGIFCLYFSFSGGHYTEL